MADAPLMLGVSGLRGIVGESLTEEVAVSYARAFGAWARERAGGGGATVVLGRDGRRGGDELAGFAARGLTQAGCDVVDLGVAMTPTVGVLVDELKAQAGMVVTASHNPQEWNGLKALVPVDGTAQAPAAADAEKLVARFRAGETPVAERTGSRRAMDGAAAVHAERVIVALESLAGEAEVGEGVLAAADSVNSSGAEGAAMLLEELGIDELLHLNRDGSGVFPHTPEPTEANLSVEGGLLDAVRESGSRVGFAQDPDADRLALVDGAGRYIGEEYTLALCAESVLSALGDDAQGAVLVANLSTSRMIDDVAKAHGARVVRSAVGEANVVETMKRLASEGERVVLGGEGNGGVIWPSVTYVRDSLGAMALVLSLMHRSGMALAELVERVNAHAAGGAGYAIEKRKQPIASKEMANPACAAVRAWSTALSTPGSADETDGLRLDWSDLPSEAAGGTAGGAGWLHVRASNTEPIMRLIAEAPTRDQAGGILDAAAAAIEAAG
ncbi:MAG: phosphoglucosamine mutase [Planctomycetota bacterium]